MEEGKKEKGREERSGKKTGKLAQSLSDAPNPPPQQMKIPGHRLFMYIGSSISIYNTPSLHAASSLPSSLLAAAAVEREVSPSGK